MLLNSGEKASHHPNKKKMRPIMHKPGRIQKKYEIDWRNKSNEFFSTSPDSPTHAGASAVKPVVRANPMFHHLEGLDLDDEDVVVSSLASRVRGLTYNYQNTNYIYTNYSSGPVEYF